MRWGRWVMLSGLLMIGNQAWADETAPGAVLNEPSHAVTVAKDLINRLDPSYETVWNLARGKFQQGVSGSLYNFKSNGIHLASARLGYATGETLYGGVGLDVPGLTTRFVPPVVKGVATTTPLNLVWGLLGRHARISLVGGYDWNEREPAYGLTAGAAWGW